MKHHIIILGALSLASILASCDDTLDKEPALSTTQSTIFADKSKIEANLLGIYDRVKAQLAYKGRAYQDIRGEDITTMSNNSYECSTVYQMQVLLTSSDNSETWSRLYAAVNEANTFLEQLQAHADVAGNDAARYEAEARFLRALSYYSLNNLYAQPYTLNPGSLSVPLRLQAENSTGGNDLARATQREVYGQILADLSDDQIARLPNGGGTYEGEARASQAAARVLRQRVYLEQEQWQKVVEEAGKITGYSLENSVKLVFTNSLNAEVIFSFPMADTNKGAQQSAQAFYYATGDIFVVDDLYGYYALPAYSLPADARIGELTAAVDGKIRLLKYPDSANYLDWIPQFRYAEVLLNAAEAYAQLGQTAEAQQLLTQVRRRSVAEGDDIIDPSTLTGDALLEAIYNERRAEFVGEGLRSIDIRRRGAAYVKRNGTWKPGDQGYTWPIPTSERQQNALIADE